MELPRPFAAFEIRILVGDAMTESLLTILPETEGDTPAIERLHERTFGPGRYARTAYRLRERVAHNIDLSYTARVGTLLVGSVRLSPVRIGETKALLLGPLTVEPPFRERGVGQALIARALQEARAKGHRLVILVGDESYYGKCGFKPVPPGRAVMPGPVDPARTLGRRTGRRRLRWCFRTDPGGIARRAGPGPETRNAARTRGPSRNRRDRLGDPLSSSPPLACPGAGETAEEQQKA